MESVPPINRFLKWPLSGIESVRSIFVMTSTRQVVSGWLNSMFFFSYTRPGKLTVCYGKSAFSMGKFTLLLVKRLPSGKLRVCYGIDGPFSSLIYLSKIGWFSIVMLVYQRVVLNMSMRTCLFMNIYDIWENFITTSLRPNPGIMVSKANYPNMVLFQVSEIR